MRLYLMRRVVRDGVLCRQGSIFLITGGPGMSGPEMVALIGPAMMKVFLGKIMHSTSSLIERLMPIRVLPRRLCLGSVVLKRSWPEGRNNSGETDS